MKNNYILKLYSDGDIEIVKRLKNNLYYDKVVYHKSYNPSESIKENLINAFEEWEKLSNE